MKLPVSFVS